MTDSTRERKLEDALREISELDCSFEKFHVALAVTIAREALELPFTKEFTLAASVAEPDAPRDASGRTFAENLRLLRGTIIRMTCNDGCEHNEECECLKLTDHLLEVELPLIEKEFARLTARAVAEKAPLSESENKEHKE